MKLALNVGFIAAVAILMLVGLISVGSMKRLTASQQWVAHTHEVREALLSLMNDVSEFRAGRRAYIITGERRYLTPQLALKHTADANIDALRSLTKDNVRQGPRLDTAAKLIHAQIDIQAKSIEHHDAHRDDLATQAALTANGAIINDQLKSLFSQMASEEAGLLRARIVEQNRRTRGAIFVGILGVALSILLLSSVVLILRKEVFRRTSAEADLTLKSSILEWILVSMADGVVVADTTGKFLHFSQSAIRMTGVPALAVSPEEWSSQYEVFQADGITPCPPEDLHWCGHAR